MPGHTRGSVGLLIPEYKTLLAGDAAGRAMLLLHPESLRLGDYVETLRAVKKLDFKKHYAGYHDRAYKTKWFDRYIKTAENAKDGKGEPMQAPGYEEYAGTYACVTGGSLNSMSFCAVFYTADKL